jgi:uncharacterized protein YyaL (SSP411 family)
VDPSDWTGILPPDPHGQPASTARCTDINPPVPIANPRWYAGVRELVDEIVEHFRAPVGFFDTNADHGTLIVRPRELQDNAVPSGNRMAALVLLRLAGLAVEPRYLELARGALGPMREMLARYPLGFAQWLTALGSILHLHVQAERTSARAKTSTLHSILNRP